MAVHQEERLQQARGAPEPGPLDRRNWLRAAARYSVLAAMGVGGALLARRSRREVAPCAGGADCAGCPLLGGCGLPVSRAFRAAQVMQ